MPSSEGTDISSNVFALSRPGIELSTEPEPISITASHVVAIKRYIVQSRINLPFQYKRQRAKHSNSRPLSYEAGQTER